MQASNRAVAQALSQTTGRVCTCYFAILNLFHRSVIGLTLKRSPGICRYFTEHSRERWPGQGEWAPKRNCKGWERPFSNRR